MSYPKRRSRVKLPPREYRELTHLVHKRDKWMCRVPGCKARSGLHAHHIVFRSQQGDDASYNLITICNHHHDGIHVRCDLVILPLVEGERIDADRGVRWKFKTGESV
jgi:hypothetical protein